MKNISVLGAGVMGHGIASVFALGGYQVTLHDVSAGALGRARKLIGEVFHTLADAGALEAHVTPSSLEGRITYTSDLATAASHAELIVEAVTEDADIKRSLFSELDTCAPLTTLWASNTSSLDVFDLVPARRQAMCLIAHWYTPPYIVDLVDVVPGPATETEVVSTVKDLLENLGKKPIVLSKFISGYVANRLQAALNLEAFFLLDGGYATPEQIDEAVKSGLGLRMPLLGILRKADYSGLELIQQLLANKTYEPPQGLDRSHTLDKLIANGRTGVMAGEGFFDYHNRPAETLLRERDVKLLALQKFLRQLGGLE
ncbi:MAG TPA: 3-hydroxyacyl-CoA dehydrogenase family protein [Terriglobia bacterium]|nr:3-hydroxyacyl-CoA dehydrogenase family protein [Terriglobia bacterium]